MIRAQDLVGVFRQARDEKWGYIWGTSGELWTALKQANLEKTTDPDRALGRKYGKKWIGHKVADCSGLFSWAFRRLGGTMYHGSNTMYLKWCVEKGTLTRGKRADFAALKPGTAVFVWNGKTYSHVGLYVGGETVIEAQGTLAGVTASKVTDSKWTHWGELAGVAYGEPSLPDEERFPAAGGSEPSGDVRGTLRRGDRGDAVRELQRSLERRGYSLEPYGADGDFGKVTEAAVKAFQRDSGLDPDGVAGPKTFAALEKPPAPGDGSGSVSAETTYAVRIGGLDLTQARALAVNYPGASVEAEGA